MAFFTLNNSSEREQSKPSKKEVGENGEETSFIYLHDVTLQIRAPTPMVYYVAKGYFCDVGLRVGMFAHSG